MTSALLALMLTSVSAGAREPVLPLPLDGVDQVTALCRALSDLPAGTPSPNPVERAAVQSAAQGRKEQAVQAIYRVTVEPGTFRYRRYEPEAGRLVIDTRWPLRAGGGWLALDLGRQELALAASPELADRAYQLWRSGDVRLVMTFELEDETQCGGMELIAPRPLAINAVSLTLQDLGGTTVLRGADDLESPEDAVEGRQPSIRVSTAVVLSGHADPKQLTEALRADDQLKQCYTRALVSQPRLWGSVVFQAQIGRGGRPGQLRVALDEVDDPALVSCLHDRLSGMRLAGAESGARVLLPIALERP